MTDKHYIERTKAFNPIHKFLLSNGITEFMTKTEIISNISHKYKSDFAQKVLDLWFGVDPYNKVSIYYKQDLAYNVDCEEITERIEGKDEIFRSQHDAPFLYKEKIDTKKVFLKILKNSKKFLVLKTLIYIFILFIIVHMGYSYYQVPEQDTNIKLISIGSIIVLSIFLLTQVNNILEEWSIIHGSGRELFYSYLILIVGLTAMFSSYKNILDPVIYFYVTTTIIALVTLIFFLLDSGVLGIFLYRSIIITERLISFMKYVIPFILLVFVLKFCTSNNNTKHDDNKKIVNKENKKTTTTTNDKIERTSIKKNTNKITEKKVESCSYYFTTATVNLRSSSSKNSKVRGKIKKSTKVCVTKAYGSWKYIKDQGWVYSQFLITASEYKKNRTKKTKVKKRIAKSVWHCKAQSERASGWVERVGKQNAMNGALHQCEIRRQTSSSCKIVNCYKL